MASTKNAFELLGGGDDGFVKAGSKKKGKKKKQAQEVAVAAVAPITQSSEIEVAADQDDTGFQPVKQQHVIKARTAAPETKSSALKASDAWASLEKEAASVTGSDRAALAAKWAEQTRQAVVGPKYTDGGKQLDFKQVLTKCRALDILVDSYLKGASAADAASLAALLAAAVHPAAPAPLPSSLAAAVVGLGQLAAADPLSAGSAHARQGVSAALGLLKSGLQAPATAEAEGPRSLLGSLDAKLGALEAQLPKTSSLKEQVKLWGDIFFTTQQKLDVVKGAGGVRAPPEVQAALGPLQSLHGALDGRIKEMQHARSGATIEVQLARADATFKNDDAALQARQGEVDGRIKALEAELAELRQEAAQLKERRSWAAQHHQQLLQKIRSGAADSLAAEVELQSSLRAVDQLAASLHSAAEAASPSQDAEALAAELVTKGVPAKFVGSVQQVADLGLRLVQELAGKAQFYRERLAQAVRQGEHLALLKLDSKAQEEHRKQLENLKKMLQDVLSGAESAVKACQDAAQAYRARLGLMLSLPSFPAPPPDFGAHLEAVASQAGQLLHSISGEAAAAPRAAARAESPQKPRASAPAAVAPERAAAPAEPAAVAAPALAPAPAQAQAPALAALEQRLAQLEEQNREKDAQIAALLSATAVEVPSPLPAMLGSPVPPPGASLGLAPLGHPLPNGSTQPAAFPVVGQPASLFAEPHVPALLAPVSEQPHVPLGLLAPTQAAGAEIMGEGAAAAAVPPRGPTSFAQALAAGRGRAPHVPRV